MKRHASLLSAVARFVVLSAALSLLTVGVAVAQDGESSSATADEMSGRNLTVKQKREFGTKAVGELEGSVRKLLKMIEDAQKANDLILLNCLNDKLGLLRGAQKASSDAEFNLSEAAARENADLVEHNFRKLYIAREQGLTLAAEAEACVGQVGSFPGQTRMAVDVEGGDSEDSDYGVASSSTTRPEPSITNTHGSVFRPHSAICGTETRRPLRASAMSNGSMCTNSARSP